MNRLIVWAKGPIRALQMMILRHEFGAAMTLSGWRVGNCLIRWAVSAYL